MASIIQVLRFYIEGRFKCAAVLMRDVGGRRGGEKEERKREREDRGGRDS